MPVIGFDIESQSSGGSQFNAPEGRYRIVNAIVANEAKPWGTVECGLRVTLQLLKPDWKTSEEEPQDEFIKAGTTEQFHPGKAKSNEEIGVNLNLEIDAPGDAGNEDGAEGTCLLCVNRGPDRKGKLGIFGASLQEHGVKRGIMNGFAANLIGLEAHFTRFMMPKIGNNKNDPTCLIVGKGGQVKGIDTKDAIHKYPDAQTGKTEAKTQPKPVPVVTAATEAGVVTTTTKVNGAPTEETAVTVAVEEGTDSITTELVETLSNIKDGVTTAGKGPVTLTRTRLLLRVQNVMATARKPMTTQKKAMALIASGDFLAEFVEDAGQGWALSPDGTHVTIPA